MANADMKVSEKLREIFQKLEEEVNEVAGKPMAISLCIFQTEEGSRMSYISNCKRIEVASAWKSLVDGWGEGMPDIPAHDYQ